MSERKLEGRAQRKLAVLHHVEEVSGNVAASCRHYGISWQCYYVWRPPLRRRRRRGTEDRSSRPHVSPKTTRPEVLEKILWLRKYCHFALAKIAIYVVRYHDDTISTSMVWRILNRLGMNRLPASHRYQRHDRRWKRYEKQRLGHQLQVNCQVHRATSSGVSGDPTSGKDGVMGRYQAHPVELRERTVRLVVESVCDGRSDWDSIRSVTEKLRV